MTFFFNIKFDINLFLKHAEMSFLYNVESIIKSPLCLNKFIRRSQKFCNISVQANLWTETIQAMGVTYCGF